MSKKKNVLKVKTFRKKNYFMRYKSLRSIFTCIYYQAVFILQRSKRCQGFRTQYLIFVYLSTLCYNSKEKMAYSTVMTYLRKRYNASFLKFLRLRMAGFYGI